MKMYSVHSFTFPFENHFPAKVPAAAVVSFSRRVCWLNMRYTAVGFLSLPFPFSSSSFFSLLSFIPFQFALEPISLSLSALVRLSHYGPSTD